MKIAIYYPWVYLTSGIERTILEITKLKEHQFTVYTHHYDLPNTYPEYKNLTVIQLRRVQVNRDFFSVLKLPSLSLPKRLAYANSIC
jgi:hypothetical protein